MLNLTVFIPNDLLNNYEFQDKPTPIHSNGNQILLHTPENKTYTSPMSGYYPAPYGFENVKDGALPTDWIFTWDGTSYLEVDDTKDGYHKVLEVRKIDDGILFSGGTKIFENNATAGTVEFWLYKDTNGATDATKIDVKGEGGNVRLLIENQDLFRGDYGSRVLLASDVFMINTWYHIRIDFNISQGGWQVQLDNTWYGSGYTIPFTGTPTEFWGFGIGSHWSGCNNNYGAWLDALSYSWDPNYNIGNNLNEGLLLSFENSTALDWIGYSLDGHSNGTIMGNTTIPFPDIGLHTIQVFANDSLGLLYNSSIRYFTIDSVIHIITPENKTYNEPMSGYYPATFGFEETITGTLPSYCNYAPGGSIPDGPGSYAKVIDSWTDGAGNTHKKVLKMYDRTSSGTAHGSLNFTKESSEICRNSTIEFWACNTLTGNYYHSYFEIWGDLGNMVSFEWDSGGTTNDPEVRITPATGEFGTGVYHEWNRWYRYSIDISCDGGYAGLGANQFRFRIYDETGALIYTSADLDLLTAHLTGGPYRYHVLSTETQSDVSHYLDGFGITGLQDIYNIGDNIEEGLLLSFENSSALDWMGYSLDGQEIKTILGNTTFSFPEDGKHSIRVFGNDPLGTQYQSTTRYFSTHHISIVTPENKTYIGPMSGYYPGTFGFECDEDDDFPKGWFDSSGANGYAKVIDGIGGHNKVLECYSSSLDDSRVDSSIFFDSQEHGSIEFWWYKSSSYTSAAIIDFWGETPGACISIRVDHWPIENNDKVEYATAAGYLDTGYPFYSDNKWMHFRIDFNCSSDTYSLWIDEVKYLDNINFLNSKDETSVNQTRFDSYNAANAVLYYVDAVSFSWDLGYSVGDNIDEGLLLSYENSTALDWQAYSLDGQSTKTIMGNTTIPLPDVGLHSIQVFANDSLGLNYYSDIRYFTVNASQIVDLIAPVITINLPGPNTLYGTSAPPYNITIIETDLNAIWYTLNGGAVNTTITELTGTIDQTLWNNRPNGTVSVRFYANDTIGNVGFEEVEVSKDILAPQITINTPIQIQLFDHTAPNFDLAIFEGNLDAVWYTLDGGLVNITTTELTGTIDQTLWNNRPNGTVSVRFYANDTIGNVGFEEVEVNKDIIAPQITINAPIQNQVFYDTPPNFELTIIEGNLDAIWYTLDDGIINFTCDISGNFNNLYWNAIPPGYYTLKFYATDTLGNLGSSEVIIEKKEPVIPGYNPLHVSLIIIVGIMGISLKLKKKSK